MRIALFLFVLLIVGCGYHVPGNSESWVGGDARILYVELANNRTAEPYLENFLTDALVAELSRARFVELTEDSALADVRLHTEITDFSSHVRAYGAADRITYYTAAMNVSVKLLVKGSNEVLWQERFQRSEDHQATADKSLQLFEERLAARQVALRLAEDIHAALLNSF